MQVINRQMLEAYWKDEPTSEQALKAWFAEAENAKWRTPMDVKAKYGNASILKEGRVVFNVCGNKFRLVVRINYVSAIIMIRFIGTHDQYDAIDAQII